MNNNNNKPDETKTTLATEMLLKSLSFPLQDENFQETPARVSRMWHTFINHPKPKLTTFPLKGKGGMILLKNHKSWGFCPHHLLPVKYTFRIGYIPNKKVLGLSKLARIADHALTTLPLQEELAWTIVNQIIQSVNPKGAGCIVHGEHLCTRMRGVKSPCAEAVSDIMWGVFLTIPSAREEFLSL
jgi:GTP cyclohydrolase I